MREWEKKLVLGSGGKITYQHGRLIETDMCAEESLESSRDAFLVSVDLPVPIKTVEPILRILPVSCFSMCFDWQLICWLDQLGGCRLELRP